jgi:Domain of unknown function (DUF4169)
MATEIINLRRVRKAKAKAEKGKAAEANRIKHGTPKTLHDLSKARSELSTRRLENSRLDDDISEDK